MVDALLNIEVTTKLLQEGAKADTDPVDAHYKQLKTDLEVRCGCRCMLGGQLQRARIHSCFSGSNGLPARPQVLEPTSDEYKIIQKYVTRSHAATHSSYKLKIQHVFKVDRHGETECYLSCPM